MINRPTNQDLERIAKLSSDYLAALRGMSRISALVARNLVLDIYACEREFIRTFHGLIDAGLEGPTAKSWDLALNSEHDWAYKNMSSQVIKNFDDGWQSNNLLLATRVMQCIGEWKGLSIEPAWDTRIAEYIKLHGPSPGIKVSNRASETSKNSLDFSDALLERAQPCSDQSKKATSNIRSFGTNVIKFILRVVCFWMFTIVYPFVTQYLFPKLQEVFSERPLVRLSKIEATRRVEIRLASYHYDLANARLVCELDKVKKQFESLEKEVLASYAPEAAHLVKPGLAKVLQRISFLKKPGKEPYWEDCLTGVGYQKYDRYTWIQGESFYGSLLAVAKRKCARPAIQVITYADAGHTNVLYKQWIHFKPDPSTGVASSVKFTVPMKMLPSGYQTRIWNHPADVRCN